MMTDSWRVQVKLFVENVVCEAIVSSTAGAIAGMVVTSEVLFYPERDLGLRVPPWFMSYFLLIFVIP